MKNIIIYRKGNVDNDTFKMERLVEIIKHAPLLSVQGLLYHINKKIQHFIGDNPQWDDITLVVLERQEK